MKEKIKSLMHSSVGFVIGAAMILTGILIQMERWDILKHWLYSRHWIGYFLSHIFGVHHQEDAGLIFSMGRRCNLKLTGCPKTPESEKI